MTPKPCPFCGIPAADWNATLDADPNYTLWYVECNNCSARGPMLRPGVDTDGNYTRAEAIRAWNTRNGK